MGETHGSCDDDAMGGATGGEGSGLGEYSCHFPVSGLGWNLSHLGGVSLLTNGSCSVRGFFGNSGVVQLGVIKTMRGNCNEDVTRGDG